MMLVGLDPNLVPKTLENLLHFHLSSVAPKCVCSKCLG